MNSVGIDISKGRSTVAVMRPFGEVDISPFEVRHTDSELSELAKLLKSLDGETRVVMEATGTLHSNRRCNRWLPNCRSIPLLWRCSALARLLARSSWRRLAMWPFLLQESACGLCWY